MSTEVRIWSEINKRFYAKRMTLVDINNGEGVKKENISRPLGITDFNDREIYEADILRRVIGGERYFIVTSDNEFLAWELPNENHPEGFMWKIEHKMMEIEHSVIVANAYENTEMLFKWLGISNKG